jgi:UDP-glucuronate decarboxylase
MSVQTDVIRADAQIVLSQIESILPMFSGSRILVTGAAGFLCSYFLDTFVAMNDRLDRPCHVIGLDNFRSGVPDRLAHLKDNPNIQFVTHDVSTPFEPEQAVDWIIHGASIASPTFYRRFPLETIDVNVNGTRHMLNLAQRGAKSLLLLSTSEIYGDPDAVNIPTSENYRGFVSCTGPRACYDESKRLAETLVMTYFRLFQTPVKTVRLFNVYGPGQRLDDQRVIPDLMTAGLGNRPIVLLSDGRATRSFCYVSDAISGMLHVLTSSENGEAFNVGNDAEEVSMLRLAELMADIADVSVVFGSTPDVHYLTDNPQRRCPNIMKLRNLADWAPKVGLRDGLTRTLESYRSMSSDNSNKAKNPRQDGESAPRGAF